MRSLDDADLAGEKGHGDYHNAIRQVGSERSVHPTRLGDVGPNFACSTMDSQLQPPWLGLARKPRLSLCHSGSVLVTGVVEERRTPALRQTADQAKLAASKNPAPDRREASSPPTTSA